jgi:uncharacterized protein YidB (DUF937 family)
MGGLGDLLGGLLGGQGVQGQGAGGEGLDDLLAGLGGGQGAAGGSGSQGGAGLGGMLAALAPMLGTALAGGGLQKLLSGFQANGMEDKVQSWVGTGDNAPLSAAEVETVVSSEQIEEIAQRLGVSHEQAASVLADVIPDVVNGVSPDGSLPDEGRLDDVFSQLAQSGRAWDRRPGTGA